MPERDMTSETDPVICPGPPAHPARNPCKGCPRKTGSSCRAFFDAAYASLAPWDIGRPQSAVIQLVEEGLVKGTVLDIGCGTGDNALYLAARGHRVFGVDFIPEAIVKAERKRTERESSASFACMDALDLASGGQRFDTVLDSAFFHGLNDDERPPYLEMLRAVLQPNGILHVLCFSDGERRSGGPRRIRQEEIREVFQTGWEVRRIAPTRYESHLDPEGAVGWHAMIIRDAV